MISRSRAIVKDLKSMKNLGWLGRPSAWLLFFKKYSPPQLLPFLDDLVWGALDRKVIRGYRWARLSRQRAEVLVPDRFPNEDFIASGVSASTLVDAATFLVQGFAQYNCDFDRVLGFELVGLRMERVDAKEIRGARRLIVTWSQEEREKFLFALRVHGEAQPELNVTVMDSDDRIVECLFLNCQFKIQSERRLSGQKNK